MQEPERKQSLSEQRLRADQDKVREALRDQPHDDEWDPELKVSAEGRMLVEAMGDTLAIKTEPLLQHLAKVMDQVTSLTERLDQANRHIEQLQKSLLALEVKSISDARSVVNKLNERLIRVEQHGIVYRGTWQRAEISYKRGDVVTHESSLWTALHPTSDRPGDGNAWAMCAKVRNGHNQNSKSELIVDSAFILRGAALGDAADAA